MSFVLSIILVAQTGNKMDTSIPTYLSGVGLAGTWLSYYTICFSSASGWCSMAADYYCNYPADTKSWKIFALTFFGITIPTSFVTIVGAVLGNAAITNGEVNTVFAEVYEEHGLGGLLLESYHPMGFSKFCLVLMIFTVLGNNVAVNYSSGLSIQLLGHYFHAIPRFVWSFINALVVAVLAIAGKDHLSTILSNFVSLLGYWTVSFTIILLIEDKWFRRNTGYDLNVWDVPSKLPVGFAAVLALLVGYLAGGVTGMAQNWYVGKSSSYLAVLLVTNKTRPYCSVLRPPIRRRCRCLPFGCFYIDCLPTSSLVRAEEVRSLDFNARKVVLYISHHLPYVNKLSAVYNYT